MRPLTGIASHLLLIVCTFVLISCVGCDESQVIRSAEVSVSRHSDLLKSANEPPRAIINAAVKEDARDLMTAAGGKVSQSRDGACKWSILIRPL